jgi:hypothetical protein
LRYSGSKLSQSLNQRRNLIASRLARFIRNPYDPCQTRKEVENLFGAWDAVRQCEWHILAHYKEQILACDFFTVDTM